MYYYSHLKYVKEIKKRESIHDNYIGSFISTNYIQFFGQQTKFN